MTFAFMAGYGREDDGNPTDEPDNYFMSKRKKVRNDAEPILRWSALQAQFPHLSKFAWEIRSIPGKFQVDISLNQSNNY